MDSVRAIPVEVSNRQAAVRPNRTRIRVLTAYLMRLASRLCCGTEWESVAVLLMDDASIRRANRAVSGRDEVTDVLSQRYDPMPGFDGRPCGEVFVNVQRAAERQARAQAGARRAAGTAHGWDASKELALYIAHGCDHLTGADDADRRGRLSMRRRELRWLKQAEAVNLTRRLMGRP
jgi:rRNA maturation RNase YbeY